MATYTVIHQLISGQQAGTSFNVNVFSPTPLLTSTGVGQPSAYYNKGDSVTDTQLGAGNVTRLQTLGAIQ